MQSTGRLQAYALSGSSNGRVMQEHTQRPHWITQPESPWAEWQSSHRYLSYMLAYWCVPGTLPEQLNQTIRLQVLNIDSNRVSGTLAASIGTMPNLVGLFIERNLFSGERYFFQSWQEWWLGCIVSIGSIPASLAQKQLPLGCRAQVYTRSFCHAQDSHACEC